MPNFNPANAYQTRVLNKQGEGRESTPGQGNYKGLLGRVEGYLQTQTADQQFEMDTAMWYGAITQPGSWWKAEVLKRLFMVLHGGGLMVRRQTGWVTWASQEQPICASISHGARVLICLPEGEARDDFWHWLWAGNRAETRLAAGHGVKPAEQIVDICPPNQVMKGIVETKENENVEHFGINIALGGNARMNMISGKIISENGKHGHVYMAYYNEIKHRFSRKKNETVPRKAVLVNCEQSAPFDREVAVHGWAGKLKGLKGVPDQYGGRHGLGGHSRFAATGGDDFNYVSAKSGPAPTNLSAYGPSLGNYYDGMYMDLTAARFAAVKAAGWRDAIIGEAGLPPIPPAPPPPLPPRPAPRPV